MADVKKDCPSENKQPEPIRDNSHFKQQSKIFHPDKNSSCLNDATEKFKLLNNYNEEYKEEQERLEKQEKERLEKDRLEKEKKDRLEKEKKERLEKEEKERLEKDRLEKEEKERLEKDRLEKEKKERLEKEEKERQEMKSKYNVVVVGLYLNKEGSKLVGLNFLNKKNGLLITQAFFDDPKKTKLNVYLVNVMVDIPVKNKNFETSNNILKNENAFVLHFINDTKYNVSKILVNQHERSILIKVNYQDVANYYNIILEHLTTNFPLRKKVFSFSSIFSVSNKKKEHSIVGLYLNTEKEIEKKNKLVGLKFSEIEQNGRLLTEAYFDINKNNFQSLLLVNLMVDVPVKIDNFVTVKDSFKLKDAYSFVLHFKDIKKKSILIKIEYLDFNSKVYHTILQHITTNFPLRDIISGGTKKRKYQKKTYSRRRR